MRKKFCLFFLCLMLFVAVAPMAAFATASSSGFKFETTLTTLSDSLKGPVARSIALIGIVVGACGAIWGAEFGQTARMLFGIILVIGILCFADSILTMMGVTSGAMLF